MKPHIPDFELKGHIYAKPDDGMLMESVTTVLKAELGLYQYGNNTRAEFGRNVHLACQYEDEGSLDYGTVAPDILLRLNQFKKAKKEHNIQILGSELKRYHPKYLYAGTLDLLANVDGKPGIIDIKTGSKEPWHALQTGAYTELIRLEHDELLLRFALYLTDTKYELIPHTHKRDFLDFLTFFVAHMLKINMGYRKRKGGDEYED